MALGTSGPDIFPGTVGADTFQGLGGDDSISGGAAPDHLIGDDGDDTVRGGADQDYIVGGAGDDRLFGDENNDRLDGGPGNDHIDGGLQLNTVDYSSAAGPVTVALGDPNPQTIGGGMGVDTLINISAVYGGASNDSLTGSAGGDSLMGNGGDDRLDGAGGFDAVVYYTATSGVTVDLRLQGQWQSVGGGSGSDFLISIESLYGGDFADTLIGDSGQNVFFGGPGNDLIDGGPGFDFISFQLRASPTGAGVSVDLRQAGPTGHNFGVDTLVSIEGVIGTAFNDTLTGDAGPNPFHGGPGADLLIGGGGNDGFVGQGGDDSLDGGAGADFAAYQAASSNYTIVARADGLFTITDNRPGVHEGADTLSSVEAASFLDGVVSLMTGTSGQDEIIGTQAADFLSGGGGGDYLEGLGGDDTLEGGAGSDWGEGGAGDDGFDGGAGGDYADGGAGNDNLVGGGGSDWLIGNIGDDTIAGGAGSDWLQTGFGADLIVMEGPQAGGDYVVDFQVGVDHIHLVGLTVSRAINQGSDFFIEFSQGGSITLADVNLTSPLGLFV